MIAALAVGLALFAAPADARPDPVANGVQVARRTFGTPCVGGQILVRRGPLPRGQIGYAEWAEPYPGAPPAERTGCVITLATAYKGRLGRAAACHAIAHEWGHLAGLGHSADPRDVMHPALRHIFSPCRDRQGLAAPMRLPAGRL